MGTDSNSDGIGNRQRLVAVARRLLGTRADAEDAVQDAYLRALNASAQPVQSRLAWLHTVTRHIAVDRLRRRRLEHDFLGNRLLVEAHLNPAKHAPVDCTFEVRAECVAALRHLLRRVSLAEAAAILLREVFEFEYADIARAAGKSEAASRQYLHRALARAHRSGHPGERFSDEPADDEDLYVGLFWRAIENRTPEALLATIGAPTTVQARSVATAMEGAAGSRAASVLVHVNGRYAIAFVLDGIVLCTVPVGTVHQAAESAAA